jgi:hypothetical protein
MRCENCDREFRPNREWQRFCDKQCQQAWHRFRYKKAEVAVAEAQTVKGAAEQRQAAAAFLEELTAQPKPNGPRFLRRA